METPSRKRTTQESPPKKRKKRREKKRPSTSKRLVQARDCKHTVDGPRRRENRV
ncbi:hypothetical protein PC116_g19488 [Phytophthora cactorum]|uniref:Uncharacterized protein n=1 Tax=Phytophthora cactorum TaxID=29920 RepID=A0A8T1CNQ4_9STRA|nr:hypothetical protein Pcac1_g22920 [Phytophthora cactorum]KAG2922102.1 hypothetical protein PC114_g5405 [Phytophthora cactorum]KAG2925440.1 hypothetical protein PC117_g15180 [Phytophthora cactorum]KAG3007041.1 hypothetical protein PC120_g17019 [Phytophthora cactorum]KAG3016707.1 hypothetical protein PC119_g11265 [Phytophthora cactorum]